MSTKVQGKTFLAGAVLALASAGIGWSAHMLLFPAAPESGEHGGDDEAPAPALRPGELSVRVTTAEVTEGDLPLVVVAAGVVRAAPAAERALSSRAGGRVLEVFATNGQRVQAGERLLRFETAPLEAALAVARAALAQAQNQLSEFERTGRERQGVDLRAAAKRAASTRQLADAQIERLAALHDEGLVSDKALAEARQAAELSRAEQDSAERAAAAFESSSAELQHSSLVAARTSAESGVREAEHVLAEAEVRAPAAGELTHFQVHAGERLEAGAALGVLLASEGRVIAFRVAASAAAQLVPGARASWNDASGAPCTGKLVRLAGEVDAASGLVEALVEPDAGTPVEPPGLAVRGELERRRLEHATLVPERAVLRAHDEQVVALATAAGTAKITHVKLLGRHAGLAAVEGEVHAGQRVILEGAYNLPDGARIVEARAEVRSGESGK